MKRIMSIIVALVAVVVAGCGDNKKSTKVESQGGNYELYVVCDRTAWEGLLGDTLRATFGVPVPMLNQVEPHFSLVYMSPEGYKGLIPQCKNQIIVNTNANNEKASMTAQYDVTAQPQLIVTLKAPSVAALTQYVWEHHDELLKVFSMAERDRAIARNAKYYEKTIGKQIEKQFGFEMSVPMGFTVRNAKENFMWLSYELPLASLGMVIYYYPYTGSDDLTTSQLLARRNQFAAMIPGPVDSSYMTTADIDPMVEYQRINNRAWVVMHGFWDVVGDYMGGPFVSFTTVDTKTNNVVTIDCYLFSPKHDKRNHMRQLESLIYSVKFPGDSAEKKGK